jgi:hypothetical protein
MKRTFWAKRILLFILFAALAILVFGGGVMLLWNNVLAQVVNVSTITFGQALGILILSKILFGGFRGGGWGSRPYWKRGMRQKWNNMTPEEREKFKQEWQNRCGDWGYRSWQPGTRSQETEHTETKM